jgi:hypothetical protein
MIYIQKLEYTVELILIIMYCYSSLYVLYVLKNLLEGCYTAFLFTSFHLMSCWRGKPGWYRNKVDMVPLCLMWTIWCEGNSQTFEGFQLPLDRLNHLFVRMLFHWMSLESSSRFFGVFGVPVIFINRLV